MSHNDGGDQPNNSMTHRSYQSFRFPFASEESTSFQSDAAQSPQHLQTETALSSAPIMESVVSSPSSTPREASKPPTTPPPAPVTPPARAPLAVEEVSATAPASTTPRLEESQSDSPRITGILTSPRSNSGSPSINRAPPRALARRASMVSFRVAKTADEETTPALVELTPEAPVANETPRQVAPLMVETIVVQREEPTSDVVARAEWSPSGSLSTGPPEPTATPNHEAVQPISYIPPLALSSAGGSTTSTRAPSVEATPAPQPSDTQQSPAPNSARSEAIGSQSPREAPSRESSLSQSARRASFVQPEVPKRANMQQIVLQKMEQEKQRKLAEQKQQEEQRQQEERAQEERAREELKAAQRQRDEMEQKRMELLQDIQRSQDAERQRIDQERHELMNERERLFNERRELEILREELREDRTELRRELEELRSLRTKKDFSIVGNVSSTSGGALWRPSDTMVSPSRDDFRRVDPMVLRELLQRSPHGAAFSYEAPLQVPALVSTARDVKAIRSVPVTAETSSRAEALRSFERWQDPAPRYYDVHEPVLQIEECKTRSPKRPANLLKRQPSWERQPSLGRGASPAKVASDDLYDDAQDFVDLGTPHFRMFQRRVR